MAAKSNADYSDATVTPVQRGKFVPMEENGQWGSSARGGAPEVQNAHDQQAAPDVLYRGKLDNNRS